MREFEGTRADVFRGILALSLVAACGSSNAASETSGDKRERAATFKFDGRLHLQHDSFSGLYTEDGVRRTATYPRRARLGVSGRLPLQLKYALDVDFDRGGVTTLRTAALAWGGLWIGSIRVGRFDPDFGLEQATSSNWITGIERSAIWDLAPDVADIGRGHGLQYDVASRHLYGSVGAFRKPQSHGAAVRAAFAPLVDERRAVHVGVSLAQERLPGDDGRIRTRLNVRGVTEHDDGNRVTLARALDDGVFRRHRLIALEAAAVAGPFSVQAEALQRRMSGGATTRVAQGQYVQVAWTLTGESRPYSIDGAKFGRIEPANARLGAWELFLRHDRLGVRGPPGLLSGGRDQGRARANVVGLNWYADEWFRVSVNFQRARAKGIANDVDDEAGNAMSVRMQVVF